MKHVQETTLGLRVPELDRVVLTSSERSALRRAAVILDGVRALRNERVPTDFYSGEDDDADLLFGWRICDELATSGFITAETVPG